MDGPAHIVFNGDVRAMDSGGARAEAIAWRGGTIEAVGTLADVERTVEPGADAIDAGGATILPGFIDAHHHPSIVAMYGGLVRLAPPAVTDVASLQRALSKAAAELPAGEWLVAAHWDELLLAERRPPTRAELDDAIPDRPLFAMHYTCHRALANSHALRLAGIGRDTPDPSGGAISRGPGGVPDGLLVERGMSRVETLARRSLVARDAEGFLDRLSRHHRALLAAGITRVVDATVPMDVVELYREAARRGRLTIPTVMLPVSASGYLEVPRDVIEGTVTGDEAGGLEVGPVKLVFDGAPGCAMCLGWWQLAGTLIGSFALSLRYGSLDPIRAAMSAEPRLGAKIRTGIHIYQRAEARDVIALAVDRGLSVATHAIGNEAIDFALSAYEAAGGRLAQKGIPRLEHAAFLSRDLVQRIAAVGAAVVTQPHFFASLPAYANGPSIPGIRNAPLRWLLDAGVKVAGSSDHPVAGFDPLDGVRAAVSRRTLRGHLYEPDQRVELEEALAMYTRVAAEVSGCLDRCGTLAAGKRADLVVLDRALRREADLEGARVRATVLGGKVVYGSIAAASPRAWSGVPNSG